KATITGVVKDAGTGKALAGASVTNGDATATTDANGAFKITVDPGSVGLSAQKAGYITATTADPVDVEAGNTVADVEIQIKPEQLPLTDDFNGGQHKDWLFPTTNDF